MRASARKPLKAGARFFTTSYTVCEATALVKRRLGGNAMRALGEAIERGFEVVWVDESINRDAWAEASRASERGPSLVDCAAFVVMRKTQTNTALAVDKHFAAAGFIVVP